MQKIIAKPFANRILLCYNKKQRRARVLLRPLQTIFSRDAL
jgi:hypothetical protein